MSVCYADSQWSWQEEDCDAAIAEPESGVQEHNETSDDLPLNIIDMEHQSDDKKQKQEEFQAHE